MSRRSFTVLIRKDRESGWYAAKCVELPEAITQGKTLTEARSKIKEAISLVLEDRDAEAKKEGGRLITLVVTR